MKLVFFLVLGVMTNVLTSSSAGAARPVRQAAANVCTEGWVSFDQGGTCIGIYGNQTASWDRARELCKLGNGDLFFPTSAQQFTFVKGLLKRGGRYWIGIFDHDFDRTFNFLNGSKVEKGSIPWQYSEPNNYRGKEYCLEMKNGRLNDNYCCKEKNFVCEARMFN